MIRTRYSKAFLAVIGLLATVYGAVMWHNNAQGEHECNSAVGQIGQGLSGSLANGCHSASLRVDAGIGIVVVGVGLFLACVAAVITQTAHQSAASEDSRSGRSWIVAFVLLVLAGMVWLAIG